jgi:hypothetical protein
VVSLELDEDEDEAEGGAAFFSPLRTMAGYSSQTWM